MPDIKTQVSKVVQSTVKVTQKPQSTVIIKKGGEIK